MKRARMRGLATAVMMMAVAGCAPAVGTDILPYNVTGQPGQASAEQAAIEQAAAFLYQNQADGENVTSMDYDPAWILDREEGGGPDRFGNLVQPLSVAAKKGNGSLSYQKNVFKLTSQQETLLLDYMNDYYKSLAKLESRDLTIHFDKPNSRKAKEAQAIVDGIVGLRELQSADLRLRSYSFALALTSVTDEDGDIKVRVLENYLQWFRAYSDTSSEGFNLSHTFYLTKTDDGWKLKEHRPLDSIRRLVLGSTDGSSDPAASAKAYLSAAKKAVKKRDSQGSASEPSYDNAYNRKAAVKYANNWVGVRKSGWPNYNSAGGNCMNFISQALYNGGIPMDTTEPGLWKYYGSTPNQTFQATGRSTSWSSVSAFRAYARTNSGYGLVAVENAPYYSGEPGDVILMSMNGTYRHVVMITEVIRDENGNTVDYLIASNTADVRDFPVSAYHYTEQNLIKIYGWNDA